MPSASALITIENPCGAGIPTVEVTALVDPASWEMRIPEALRDQLQLKSSHSRSTTSNQTERLVPYVGLAVRFEDRRGFTGALVCGDEVVVGSLALQELNLSIDAEERKLIANAAPVFVGEALAAA